MNRILSKLNICYGWVAILLLSDASIALAAGRLLDPAILNEQIVKAIDADDLESLNALVFQNSELGCSWRPEISQEQKDSYLVYAVQANRPLMVQCLLAECFDGISANPMAFEAQGLCEAAANGYLPIVKILLTRPLNDVGLRTEPAISLGVNLHQASQNHVVVDLISQEAQMSSGSSRTFLSQALAVAAEQGQAEVVKWLLELFSENTSLRVSVWGGLALSLASQNGYAGIVEMLLTLDVQKNPRCFYGAGSGAVSLAAANGHCEVVRLLLTKGHWHRWMQLNVQGSLLAFTAAVQNDKNAVVEMLLKEGFLDNANGSVLSVAARFGCVDALHFLFRKQPVESRPVADAASLNALHEAFRANQDEAASVLLKYLPELLTIRIDSRFQPVLLKDLCTHKIAFYEACSICAKPLVNFISNWSEPPTACALSCGHLFHKICIERCHKQQLELGQLPACKLCHKPSEYLTGPVQIREFKESEESQDDDEQTAPDS